MDSITCRKSFPFVGTDKIAIGHRRIETAPRSVDTGHGFCIADVYHQAVENQHRGYLSA